ncbi:hypothetical protein E4U19_006346 [Claviceps sp. Clav32 group G5]|nr:hypothetical protein E4U19_006346 [Claviceps sp. Clav32 group G5]
MGTKYVQSQTSRLSRDLTLPYPTRSKMPKLVYGTAWKKEKTADLVYAALKTGFRGVDTAAQPKHYNEEGVAAGVKRAVDEGIVKRQDLFIQTKFTAPAGQNHITPYDINAPLIEKVHQSIQSSLDNFTLGDGQDPYLDCVVLHAPMDTLHETLTVWRVLESYTPHKIVNLGVSNTTLSIVEALYHNMAVRPAIVQNRFYDGSDFEHRIRAYCREKRLVFQSFWTLSSNADLLRCEPVKSVAKKAEVDPVAAYYTLVIGLGSMSVLDGTSNLAHMEQDLEGLEKIGIWAEREGRDDWEAALTAFKEIIGDK